MDEANQRLQQAPATSHAQRLAQRQAQAVAVLAKRRAIAATRKRLRGMGLKPQYMPMREMAAMVEEYLDQHWPVLIAEARPIVDRWTAEGFFGNGGAALSVRPEASEILSATRAKRGDKINDRSVDLTCIQ